jgi:methionine biosynthesis protein MetW
LIGEQPVLDIGGGDGLLLSSLRDRRGFQQLSLIDLSPVAVGKARQKGFDAIVGDVTQRLPFGDNTFGTACALDVLEHLYDPVAALREMARVARTVVIVVPNFQYWKDRVRVLCGNVPFSCRPRRGHVYWFNYQTLLDIVRHEELPAERFVVGAFRRLNGTGTMLARARPQLFAHSFALRLRTENWPPRSDPDRPIKASPYPPLHLEAMK